MRFTVAAAATIVVVQPLLLVSSFHPPLLSIKKKSIHDSTGRNAWKHRSVSFQRSALGVTSRSSEATDDVEQSTTTKFGSDDDDDQKQQQQQQQPWWKDYKLVHADVAERARKDFPILSRTVGDDNNNNNKKPLIYLDSAATSQKPTAVIDALMNYYETYNSNVHRGAHLLSRDATAAYEASRDAVAALIGANSRNEVVFTSGATEAINLVVNSYGRAHVGEGDEIVLSVMEHHSNLVPWQMLAQDVGATIKYAKLDSTTGGIDRDHFASLLNEKTKIVAFQHVSNVMGCINPVEGMVKVVRDKSPHAKIVLDACQSVPHQPVDVPSLGVDFLAASGHKMCAPTGIGFLWAPEDLLNSMPPFLGGGEMIDQVTLDGSTFAPAPARFEAGTPAIAQAIGLGSAITYLNSIGMDRIEAYEHELAHYMHKRLAEVEGVTVIGPPLGTTRGALCAFVCEQVHPSDLSTFLDIEGVAIRAGHHCCQPLHHELGYSHSARASLSFYNTKEEVDMFIKYLQQTLDFFGNMGDGDEIGESDDDFVPFI